MIKFYNKNSKWKVIWEGEAVVIYGIQIAHDRSKLSWHDGPILHYFLYTEANSTCPCNVLLASSTAL